MLLKEGYIGEWQIHNFEFIFTLSLSISNTTNKRFLFCLFCPWFFIFNYYNCFYCYYISNIFCSLNKIVCQCPGLNYEVNLCGNSKYKYGVKFCGRDLIFMTLVGIMSYLRDVPFVDGLLNHPSKHIYQIKLGLSFIFSWWLRNRISGFVNI